MGRQLRSIRRAAVLGQKQAHGRVMARFLTLRDGRALAWRSYGRTLQAGGVPVIFHHGNLNSRCFAPSWGRTEELAQDAGAWVVAVDRPGYGASSPLADRSYASWASDVEELADHLRLHRYAVVGYSSGGPHAMACAALDGRRRIAACGLVSSDAPYARMPPGIIQRLYGVSSVDLVSARARAARNAESMREAYSALPSEKRRLALLDLDTSVTQGLEGAASDSVLEASKSWGFALHQVQAPVILWHGTADKDVPLAAGQFLAQELGKGMAAGSNTAMDVRFIDGETHSLIRRRWFEILSSVVARAQATTE